MRKLQAQGVHHITIVGADRQTSIDFWEGVLGMPFVFEQPNLDNEAESHLYFDPGDGRLITVFTNEERAAEPAETPREPGHVHHLAFSLSQATFRQAVERLDERGIRHSGVKDRGFMDSIYFDDPLGLLIELASYRFEPPYPHTHAEVLLEAHRIRVERGDYNIAEEHLADAIEPPAGIARQRRPRVDRVDAGHVEHVLFHLADELVHLVRREVAARFDDHGSELGLAFVEKHHPPAIGAVQREGDRPHHDPARH